MKSDAERRAVQVGQNNAHKRGKCSHAQKVRGIDQVPQVDARKAVCKRPVHKGHRNREVRPDQNPGRTHDRKGVTGKRLKKSTLETTGGTANGRMMSTSMMPLSFGK
ncbi:MAG: hypothetical protein V8R49_05500 [Duodenibacillus massiliensis]